MTLLHKAVKRETRGLIQGRQLVITLEPGDMITIRQKGRRTRYTVTIEAVYALGAKMFARSEQKRIAEERKARKAVRS